MAGTGNLANLKPFQAGNKQPRAFAAKLRALTMCRLHAPEMVEFALGVVRDPEARMAMRLKAAELILDKAIPTPKTQPDEAEGERPGTRSLDVVFVHRCQAEAEHSRKIDQVEATKDARGTLTCHSMRGDCGAMACSERGWDFRIGHRRRRRSASAP